MNFDPEGTSQFAGGILFKIRGTLESGEVYLSKTRQDTILELKTTTAQEKLPHLLCFQHNPLRQLYSGGSNSLRETAYSARIESGNFCFSDLKNRQGPMEV